MKPIRIQLSRKRGWRLPPNSRSVARPGKWGNPYPVEAFGRDLAMLLFGRTARGYWSPGGIPANHIDEAYRLHTAFLKRFSGSVQESIWTELRGLNLGCWCKPSEKCHADIYLEIANMPWQQTTIRPSNHGAHT